MREFFLRATAECFARFSYDLSVCLSVRPSVRLFVCPFNSAWTASLCNGKWYHFFDFCCFWRVSHCMSPL